MSYPDAVNLPFNAMVLGDSFVAMTPDALDNGEPGYWAIISGPSLVVVAKGEARLLPEGPLPVWLKADAGPVLLGTWQGRPLRAARIAGGTELPAPHVVEQFNATEDRLDDRLLTLGGYAQQVLHWERHSACCPRCGGAMERIPGSWGKRCHPCRGDHYPHIHPCAIVLVRRGDEFLLIRKPEWPPGRYSLVAGFLDFGESLEECARREVREETGVEVANIRYVGSQSWPFPSQLMAGFVADYVDGAIRVDLAEIEDARWFCPTKMPDSLPGKRSIARWIIDTFALGH